MRAPYIGAFKEGKAPMEAFWALGTMSGTSLDGVDAALVLTDGVQIEKFGPSRYREYTPGERAVLRSAQGCWQGDPRAEAAAQVVEDATHESLSRFGRGRIVGFHGQTLAHDPAGRRTHQAGVGMRLARGLGKTVIWDFRSVDVELGGQGAPLAPFFHFALANYIGAKGPIAFLNLGGIANLTWVDPTKPSPETPGALLAFDTGPANAPINDLMVGLNQSMDAGGALALSGTVDETLVHKALSIGYFAKIPPKSLDRSEASAFLNLVRHLNPADGVATLGAIAAEAVAQGLAQCPVPPAGILVSGGGRHNAALMQELQNRCPVPIDPVENAGLDGDMLEAQAFAFLAVRVQQGLPTSAPGTTGVSAAVGGGIISTP